jgi:hypothetical protein
MSVRDILCIDKAGDSVELCIGSFKLRPCYIVRVNGNRHGGIYSEYVDALALFNELSKDIETDDDL